jgi:hypothetical protein
MGGFGLASSPFPFPAGGDTHCHLQKKKKTKLVDFIWLFFRSIQNLMFSFPPGLFFFC